MKITEASRLSALALQSFDESIAPELKSPAALAATSLIRDALRAAAHRGAAGVPRLGEANQAGERVADELRAALAAHGVDVPSTAIRDVRSVSGFDDLAHAHADLSAQLAALISTFSRHVPTASRTPSDRVVLRDAAEWEARSVASMGSAAIAVSPKAAADALPREALEAFIQRVHPDGRTVKVAQLERVNGGFGKQTYLLTVSTPSGGTEHLVVRKEDRVMLCDHRSFRLEREFALVAAVHRTGFPAPKPLWFGRDVPGIDAAFYVMERLPGGPAGSFLGGAAEFPESLARDFAARLARLHQIPLVDLKDMIEQHDDPAVFTETVEQGYRRHIADWREYVETADTQPSPMLAFLFDWLQSQVPKDEGRPVLVHGDYSIHNVLVQDGEITGVLDWEAALFGAPGIDLAYVQLALGHRLDWPAFLQHYRDCGGPDVDAKSLNFHLAFQAAKIMVTMVRAQHLVISGKMDDIRLTSFELGFLPQFMQIALSSTATP